MQEASFQVDGGDFKVSVIDATEDYVEMMRSIFDFDQLQKLLARKDFSLCFDGMHGVSGPYARKIFVDILAVPADQVMRCDVLPDFGGAHPDPNLTYAPELVEKMGVFNS